MQIIEYTAGEDCSSLRKRLPFADGGCVIALGFFDGVHIAHRALLSKARAAADERGLPMVVFTFSGKDTNFKKSSGRLYTDEEKCSLLSEVHADYTLICSFSSISSLSREDFVRSFLVGTLSARAAVCGFNFRFGKGALGTAADLCSLMAAHGCDCIVLSELLHTGRSVSSTRIKELIENRGVRSAAALLGAPYFMTGVVNHGLGKGRELGLPTVNTELPEGKFAPPRGVYATRLKVGDIWYSALTNIGTCPTLGERALHAETYILDFDGDLYGNNIRIYFVDYLREERLFLSEAELVMQINLDKLRVKEIMGETKWQEIGLN